jgi:hypothetical protein
MVPPPCESAYGIIEGEPCYPTVNYPDGDSADLPPCGTGFRKDWLGTGHCLHDGERPKALNLTGLKRTYPATLLVVNLLVGAYNLVRDGSRAILPRAGTAYSPTTQARRLQPGGHD